MIIRKKLLAIAVSALMLCCMMPNMTFAANVEDYSIFLTSYNTDGVQNNPKNNHFTFEITKTYNLKSITTYHWNNGNGKIPGTISLYEDGGKKIGSWQAVGRSGSGRENVNWDVFTNVTIKPGEYYIDDSSPETRSANAKSGWEPFVELRGNEVAGNNNQNTDVNGSTSNIPKNADLRVFNGHTYLVVYDEEKPDVAEKRCKEMGGYLATVTSKEENDFLKTLYAEKNKIGYILGGTDRDKEGVWTWMNGEAWSFTDWNSPIEPNNGLGRGENYLFAGRNTDWKWVDFFGGYDNYSSTFPFVCEWNTKLPSAKETQTTTPVSSSWFGTWSSKGVSGTTNNLDLNDVFYIEQSGEVVYITYYSSAESNTVYGSMKGKINSDGSIIGLNWFGEKTGQHDVTVSITRSGNTMKIIRTYPNGSHRDILVAEKISDSYPKDKIFNGNKNASLGNTTEQPANNTKPTPDNAVPVTVTGGKGKATTLVFNGVTGVTVSFKTGGVIGYRLYRSESSGSLGVSVTDFYITSNNFTDVNVEPNTTYYYTLKEVLAEADPLNDKREKIGDVVATWTVKTADSVGKGFANSSKTRHFIMLKIDDPKMSVDGEAKEVDPGRGTVPMILRGRTMVPIRAIVEAMGGNVGWNASNREVSLKVNSSDVRMWVDKKELTKNSAKSKIDVPPSIINNRTFVPLRFGTENLNCQVDWINSTRSIVIVWSE